ncbi:MAG: DUF1800 domain-containing protein [Acidobacteria bacterium]|nr:DUF1800 domain-containing protein [Acidobacteriota bacterium]MCA1617385.1 DUF1800 domain-containing protein [Acidobacteriota bacterium]
MATARKATRFLSFLFLMTAAAAASVPAFSPSSSATRESAATSREEREKALHALNRLTFGPRPGDVDRVLDTGLARWIDAQLKPEAIADPAMAARLGGLPTLAMSSEEIFNVYEKPIREARRQRRLLAGSAAMSDAAAGTEDLREREERDRIPPEKRPRRVIEELSTARVLKAVYSERQLNEVLVDFWMNHFNVYAAKGLDRVFITSFERDVVRPRIWGRFEDLILATAKSPAMLFYLDNAQSVSEPENRPSGRASGFGRGAPADAPMLDSAPPVRPKGGLNENYARELMELHTLGVDGGYTQKDVTELARVLTGWSIERDGGGTFVFRARVHDTRVKTVLGRTFPAGGGIEEGEEMIRRLARHPETARHIAFKLAQRLVSDAPPPALVDRVAKKFLATDGDLRQTVRAVLESPEFFDRSSYRAKVKSPFEYVVSAIRATGAETDAGIPLLKQIAQMGEPLYLCQPPTGYSDAASAWVNTGALVSRMNFALALSANKLPGTFVDVAHLIPPADAADPGRSLDALARVLISGDLTSETRATIAKQLETRSAPADDPSANTQVPLISGLILGSPEFQKQ